MTIAVGIDPGIATIGLAIVRVEGDTRNLIYYGTIKTSSKDAIGQRLFDIEQEISSFFNALTVGIDMVAIEIPFFGPKISTGPVVNQALGAILLGLHNAGYRSPVLLQASQVKEAAGGKGSADKAMVRAGVERLFNVEFPKGTPDDAIDAVAIAYAGAIGKSAAVTHVKKSRKKKGELKNVA